MVGSLGFAESAQ